jgi:XrtJ-associated TM-motif-TM protein
VKKLAYMLPVALLILAAALPARAQMDGCVDSPENPTAILALVGIAAAGINQLRVRFGGRK